MGWLFWLWLALLLLPLGVLLPLVVASFLWELVKVLVGKWLSASDGIRIADKELR